MGRWWSWMMACALTTGCAMLPVRSISGASVRRVIVAETNWKDARQPEPIELAGVELAETVALLDRHDVLAVRSLRHVDVYAMDGYAVTIAIELGDGRYVSITADSYAEPHVCAFFRDAVTEGVMDHVPNVCKRARD